jgi:DsbC/DsbD-like thiol-disulfide interchange protein
MRRIIKLLFLTATFFAIASAANAQSVTGSLGNGTFTPGKTVRAKVVLGLPDGLHANSRYPGTEYAIPTTVSARGSGLRIGAVSYPRGHNRTFEFSSNPINVYEDRTTFKFDVIVPANYARKTISVNVKVRYQACTNEVCYPPKTKDITLTARAN